jgi:hypothetical protein
MRRLAVWPTLSGIELAALCSASLLYPEPPKKPGNKDPSHLRIGNAVHETIEGILRGQSAVAALACAAEKHELTAAMAEQAQSRVERFGEWWRLRVGDSMPRNAETEVAYAIDPRAGTSRRLITKHHRDYSDAKPGELCGTADIVLLDRDPAWLIDVKTGFHVPTPPPDNGQLRALGYAVAKEAGLPAIRVMLLMLSPEAAQEVPPRPVVLDCFDLDDIEAELARVADEVQSGTAARPGRWCEENWCRGKKAGCEAYAAMRREAVA